MIYTLSSSGSFCDILVKKWLDEGQSDLWGLSRMTIFLPTNRAVRTFKEAFLRQSEGKTLLLPKVVSLSDLDVFECKVPDPISSLERQLILSKLIQKKQPMGEDKAFALAQSLAELIDEMHYYDVSFENLKEIAPEEFASHWQETLSFLQIIETFWNDILKQRGKIDPSSYQIKQIENVIECWKKNPPKNEIKAVGFTGGLPIIEKFLKEVSKLPNAEIYIPDLDKDLPEDIWDCLDEIHPQFYLKKLLDYMEVKRSDVINLEPLSERYKLLSCAMLPSFKTFNWQKDLRINADENIKLIECETPQSESFEIASLLRGVLETPEKTAALVTTDRQLARRVKAQMLKWNILLDDSAGMPLSSTPVGTFLISLAQAATSQKQSDLLCVLKHPLCLDGHDFSSFRKNVHQAEKQARETGKKLNLSLNTDLSVFMNLFVNPIRIPFDVLLKAHLQVAQDLCASSDRTGAERLWDKESGQMASDLLSDLLKNAELIGDIEPLFYADFFKAILQTVSVRPKYGMHPRLDILGPIEARLQQPDLVIVGGLNEGVFPQLPSSDNWMNRKMRQMCGLPDPEEKIGVAAQDFMHLLQAKEVILTRALKQDGTPTIPSRWLARLEAVLEKTNQSIDTYREGFLPQILNVKNLPPISRPCPVPPLDSRPDHLSISDISTFLQDPYSIYAKHILKLCRLPALSEEPNEASFGNVVHNSFAAFLGLSKEQRTKEKLLSLGDSFFEKEGFDLEKATFYRAKFVRIADWFIKEVENAFPQAVQMMLEKTAIMQIKLENKDFYLKGRADRIDIFADNTAQVIDYKSGFVPTKSAVAAGYAPQLPLEALMLEENCFEKKNAIPKEFSYWHVSGKGEGGEIIDVTPEKDMHAFLDEIRAKLIKLLESYNNSEAAYPACPKPEFQPRYNDYAHLERLSEWQEGETSE